MGFFSRLEGRVVGGPSILAANFAHLAEDVRRAEEGGAELVHFDTMDNHFVPNLTIGPLVAASLVPETELPVDAHLMVTHPDNLIPEFLEAGVKSISVQPEVVRHLHRTLSMIRDGGAEAGVALNPTTPPESI
nr:ribulose-phosphate 3-epimerase [Rubrobacter sp.]